MRGIEILNIVVVILSLVPFVIILFKSTKQAYKNKILQTKGILTTALIKQVTETNTYINNLPIVKLTLELKDNTGILYQAECKTALSLLNFERFKPGMLIQVKIDPESKNVAIDEGFLRGSPSPDENIAQKLNAQELEIDLKRTQQIQNEVETSGTEAKAIIKTYTWLGANVNGNNPYVELEVEVLPDDIPAFSGKTRCVIGSANTNKFQPGSEVFVKYLQQNKSRIIITHS